MIRRLPCTLRYRVSKDGRRTAMCFRRIYEGVLCPRLSVALAQVAPHPAPVARLMDRPEAQID